MSNTLTAQFAPSASMRITDPVVYAAIAAQYGFGTNIIFGISPQTLATAYGINYVNNPTTSDYNNLPCVFTTTAGNVVLGTTIATNADGVQTLTGQDYTDSHGTHFTSVTWEWQVEVQFYTVLAQDVFSQQVVTWTGDASANRHIATTANLSSGVTAILILGTGAPVFCTSAMIAAGKHATGSINPASTTLGVMTLDATGFTITGGANVSVNVAAALYTAIVWHDGATSFKMAVGSYLGDGGVPLNPKTVNTGLAAQTQILLLTGRAVSMVYADNDHGIAIALQENEATPLTGLITAMGLGSFSVGTDINVNTGGTTYYFVAFAIPSTDAIRQSTMQTIAVAGTVAAVDHMTGLGFTPAFAIGSIYSAAGPATAWRSPNNAGTTSKQWTNGGDLASGYIESFAAGDVGFGATLAPNASLVYGLALAGAPAASISYPLAYWTHTEELDLGDGTTSLIETAQQSQVSPGAGWTFVGLAPTFGWWCNAVLGLSVYQIDSPGTGWAACSGPASANGWYLSTAAFGNQDTIVSAGRPADPRPWAKLSTWTAIGNMAVFGGSPGAACTLGNQFIYPASNYTVGTHYPPIRIFDGRQDRELCRLPPTTANVIPKAVMSMLAANGTVYLTTWDSGTTSADWAGRVFSLNTATGELTVLGTVFAAGEMPYALAWHMGRLWCGTNNSIGTVGKVYFFRPGIDTTWTSDYSLATSTAGGVTSMASYGGKLYVGTDNAAASRGKVLVRDTAGAYTTSQTGAGGTARVNNGYLALTVLGANLYASYWNNDTTVISRIEKYTGSAWSTAYTGVGVTLRPFISLILDNAEIYALGGSIPYDAALVVTSDGTTWTDLTALLPVETATLLPMFGAVVP